MSIVRCVPFEGIQWNIVIIVYYYYYLLYWLIGLFCLVNLQRTDLFRISENFSHKLWYCNLDSSKKQED